MLSHRVGAKMLLFRLGTGAESRELKENGRRVF